MKKPHNYRDRTCLHCNITYKPSTSRQKYCSKKCYDFVANKKNCTYKKEWAYANKDKVTISKSSWVRNNPEKRKEASDAFRKRNKEYYCQYASLRSRYFLIAKPKWADDQELLDVYKEASHMQLEVDHIIPLKHGLVCGLHVVSNLQLLTRSENAKKSNKFSSFDEDILGVM